MRQSVKSEHYFGDTSVFTMIDVATLKACCLVFFVSIPSVSFSGPMGFLCDDGSDCGGGTLNGIFGAILIAIFLSYLGARVAAIYLVIWLAPVFVAFNSGEKGLAALWGVAGAYISIFITAWICDRLDRRKLDETDSQSKSKVVIEKSSEKNNSITVNAGSVPLGAFASEGDPYFEESNTYVVLVVQSWTNGPFWGRAFSAECLKSAARRVGLIGLADNMSASNLALLISTTEGAKEQILNFLVDAEQEPICSYTDHTESVVRYQVAKKAKELNWHSLVVID